MAAMIRIGMLDSPYVRRAISREKIVRETQQPPEDKRHGPWLERVTGQAKAASAPLD